MPGDPVRHALTQFRHRLTQVRHHLTAGTTPVTIPDHLAARLTGEAETRFRTLSAGDQVHLVVVATTLAEAGAGDDLITAGLLHDIGKSVPGISIRLHDRVAKTVVERIAPSMLARLRQRADPPTLGSGLWVLSRHAGAGAEIAARSGYNERVQWLIAHHERAELDDPDLAMLVGVDGDSFPLRTR